MNTRHCRKNAYSSDADGIIDYVTERGGGSTVVETKPHYYGSITHISNNDDAAYIRRGSIYYLPDNVKDPNTTFHPYMVIQSSYLDKIGKISVLAITSAPTSINMIPFAMRGKFYKNSTIGYIDPHQPFTYRVDDFTDPRSRYIATIVNENVINLACDMYGMHLGMNLVRSNDEIIQAYKDYVDDFNNRSAHLVQYRHKVMPDNGLTDHTLHISFNDDQIVDDDIDYMIDDFNDDDACVEATDERDMCSEEVTNNTIVVDLKSEALLSMIAVFEKRPPSKNFLPRNIENFTRDEIIVFLAYRKLYGVGMTSLLYGCSTHTIARKHNQLCEKYTIIYQD